jgi:glyoxylase-like metal-dependent hydrolase (beta-lactamase superfamily II)
LKSYHFSVGQIKLMVLLDGSEIISEKELHDVFKPLPDAFLQASRNMPRADEFCYNVLYLESGGEHILIDTGIGAVHQPQYGNMLDVLKQEGIAAEQIDKVLISHLHLDHIGGLTADHRAIFPNAEIYLPRLEWEHWVESGRAPAERTEIVKGIFQPYSERIHDVNDGDRVAEGVTATALPGHTPGHCGFMIESSGERLLHMVDTLHHLPQVVFPEVSPVFDIQPDVSPVTRRRVLEQAAEEGLLTLAYHLRFPGIGHIIRNGETFAWQPIE